MIADRHWLELAAEIARLNDWWKEQDAELDSARAGLSADDRDAGAESAENDRIASRRAGMIRDAVSETIFGKHQTL